MSESELQRLERESREWAQHEGEMRYYPAECPGAMKEHNRQVRIQQLRGRLPEHQDPNPPYGSSEYWDRRFPVDL